MSDPQSQPNPYAPPTEMADAGNLHIDFFGSPEEMGRVATGLSFVYWGIVLILLAIVGSPLFFFAAGGGGFGNGVNIGLLGTIAMALGLLFIAGVIVGIIGRVLCLAVPESSGARPMIVAAVACDAIVVVLSIGSWVSPVIAFASNFNNLLSLIATLFFILFMSRVSAAIGRADLENRATGLIKTGAIIFVLAIGTAATAFFVVPLFAFLGLALLVIGLLLFFRYVRLIVDLRKAILNS